MCITPIYGMLTSPRKEKKMFSQSEYRNKRMANLVSKEKNIYQIWEFIEKSSVFKSNDYDWVRIENIRL